MGIASFQLTLLIAEHRQLQGVCSLSLGMTAPYSWLVMSSWATVQGIIDIAGSAGGVHTTAARQCASDPGCGSPDVDKFRDLICRYNVGSADAI